MNEFTTAKIRAFLVSREQEVSEEPQLTEAEVREYSAVMFTEFGCNPAVVLNSMIFLDALPANALEAIEAAASGVEAPQEPESPQIDAEPEGTAEVKVAADSVDSTVEEAVEETTSSEGDSAPQESTPAEETVDAPEDTEETTEEDSTDAEPSDAEGDASDEPKE